MHLFNHLWLFTHKATKGSCLWKLHLGLSATEMTTFLVELRSEACRGVGCCGMAWAGLGLPRAPSHLAAAGWRQRSSPCRDSPDPACDLFNPRPPLSSGFHRGAILPIWETSLLLNGGPVKRLSRWKPPPCVYLGPVFHPRHIRLCKASKSVPHHQPGT